MYEKLGASEGTYIPRTPAKASFSSMFGSSNSAKAPRLTVARQQSDRVISTSPYTPSDVVFSSPTFSWSRTPSTDMV